MALTCCCTCLAMSLFVITGLLGAAGIWILIPNKSRATCSVSSKMRFAARGDNTAAPENTLQAIIDATRAEGIDGPEFDVRFTSDHEAVVFNDDNAFRATYENSLVSKNTFEDVTKWKLRDSLNGMKYEGDFTIPGLADVLEELCFDEESRDLNIEINGRGTDDSVRFWRTYHASDCGTREKGTTIFTTTDPVFGRSLVKQIGIDVPEHKTYTALSYKPNAYIGGEHVWLKTRLWQWISKANTLSLHHSMMKSEWDVVRSYRQDGFCLAVYGGTAEELQPYANIVDFMIVNTPDTVFFNEETYQKRVWGYWLLMGIVVTVLILFVVSIVWLLVLCTH